MTYTTFDRFVALWRFRAAFPHVRPSSKICDIGCGHGAPFLRWARARIAFGVGLDHQVSNRQAEGIPIVRCDVTRRLPLRDGFFDHAIMLAVLEHLRDPRTTLREAFRILAPGGSLILTWPNQMVDPVLNLLHRVHLVSDTVESEKHVRRVPLKNLLTLLRAIGFEGFIHRTFELGLNNLLVAHKESVRVSYAWKSFPRPKAKVESSWAQPKSRPTLVQYFRSMVGGHGLAQNRAGTIKWKVVGNPKWKSPLRSLE